MSSEHGRRVKRIVLWASVPTVLGFLGFGLESGAVAPQWAIWTSLASVLEAPSVINLGEQERDDVATARFAIANRGSRDLLISEPRTSCACAGLEREADGKYFRLDQLKLKGGEHADLVLRVRVKGRVGGSMITKLTFATNDPISPLFTIHAVVQKVRGGVSSFPTCALFGDVLEGAHERRVLIIWDDAMLPRDIARVTSSRPDQFSVQLLPLDHKSSLQTHPTNGRIIGRVEVQLQTNHPASVESAVQVFVSDEKRPPLTIPVCANVNSVVQLTPPSLVLPRRSVGGPVWSAACLCRTSEGEAFELEVVQSPPGFRIAIEPSELFPGAKTLIIESDYGSKSDPSHLDLQTIQLRAVGGGRVTEINLPVRLLGKESAL